MSALYPEELLEEIRFGNDIVDVVSEYVKLERKGKYYFGLCPFHKEKTASFTVTPDRQIFNCFGCDKGGNVFHFIMNIENLDFIEAVKLLADRARISLPEQGGKDAEKKAQLRKKVLNINTEAAKFFHNILVSKQGSEAREFLKRRGITNKMTVRFGLGYSADKEGSLLDYLTDKGYKSDDLIGCGLVINGSKGLYDRFRGRVMFPIFDIRGNVIGFGGRVIRDMKPKYMNSPESSVYNKRKNLYGLNFAKRSKMGMGVVVEGYMDVISLHQSGIICSVASLGTSLTESQGRLLKKYFDEIIIAYDADTAGKNAAMRGLEMLDRIGCSVKVAGIPGGMDPDDYVRKNGKNAFLSLVEDALPLVEYKIAEYRKEMDDGTTEGKIKFIDRMAGVLSSMYNRVEMEVYINKLAGEYGISQDSLYEEVLKKKGNGRHKTRITANFAENGKDTLLESKKGRDSEELHDELMLLAVLSTDNSMYQYIADNVCLEDFKYESVSKAVRNVIERIEKNNMVVPAEVLNILDTKEAQIFSAIIEKECKFDESKKPLDIVRRIRINRMERRRKEIKQELKNRDMMDKETVLVLEKELNEITLKMTRTRSFAGRRGDVETNQ